MLFLFPCVIELKPPSAEVSQMTLEIHFDLKCITCDILKSGTRSQSWLLGLEFKSYFNDCSVNNLRASHLNSELSLPFSNHRGTHHLTGLLNETIPM
jgi:hypothetical protein